MTSYIPSQFPSYITDFEKLEELHLYFGSKWKLNKANASLWIAMGMQDEIKKELNYHWLYNDTTGIIPKEINNLKNLRVLNLSGDLKNLPLSMQKLTNLEELQLAGNFFSEKSNLLHVLKNSKKVHSLDLSYNIFSVLPSEIENFISLKKLELDENRLFMLPKSIGNIKTLIELQLSDNLIIELPKSIGSLTQLEILNLSNNKLIKLHKSIRKLENLKTLNLHNSQLTSLPKSIKILNKKDLSIALGGNNFSETEKIKIRKWLSKCSLSFEEF